jgi:molybdopterin-guanine dinucleotide biosynthesis protein MobB
MAQSARDADAPFPRIVTVAGLKKSGKTTVVEALISELKARGYRVGSIKTMEDALRFLDPAGTDTRRHADAGADVVVALLGGETVRFERGSPPRSLQEIVGFFNPGTHFLVCEGMSIRGAPQAIVLCLRSMDELSETLSVRGLALGSILAISGVAGAGSGSSAPHGPSGIPVFDVVDVAQLHALVDRIIEASHALTRSVGE